MSTHLPTEVSGVREGSRARNRRLWCLALVATAAAAPAVVGVKAAAAAPQARAPIGVTVLIGPVRMPPTPLAAPEWLAVANVIGDLGGNSLVFQLLNGSEDPGGGAYALVALDGATAQEASYERTHGNGVLTGVLVSSPRGHYQPLAADYPTPDPAGKDRYAFLPFLYSAPSSWNDWVRVGNNLQPATAGQNAALANIVQTALANGWIPQNPLCPNAPDPLRGYYCDTVATDLTTLSQRIGSRPENGTRNGAAGRNAWRIP